MPRTLCAVLLLVALSLSGPVSAQVNQEQAVFNIKALAVLQGQRDDAMNRLVNAEARAAMIADEVAALRLQRDEATKNAAAFADEVAALKKRITELEQAPEIQP